MLDTVIFLKNNLADHFVIYFIPLYVLGGRPVALLSAQFLGFRITFLLPVVVMLDTLQIPLFYYVFGTISIESANASIASCSLPPTFVA